MTKQENHEFWTVCAKILGATHFFDVYDIRTYVHYPMYIFSEQQIKRIKELVKKMGMQAIAYIIEVK